MSPRTTEEDRARRAAFKQGYALLKSRRRDPNAPDYGTYRLCTISGRCAVFGEPFGDDLAAIAEFLGTESE